jgi:hypothetical protein
MAVASLTNFTVPLAAGGASSTTQGLLMPKLKYRFRVSFVGFGVNTNNVVVLTTQVQDAKRPSVKFNGQALDIYNSKVYFQGKPEWDPLNVTLRDDATGAVSTLVGQQIQKQFDFQEQASAASGIDYKFQLQIDILDGGNGTSAPNTLESWTLYGCFLDQVDYGELNYNSQDPQTIALTVRFDNAEQLPAGGQTAGVGFGQAIAKSIGSTITG